MKLTINEMKLRSEASGQHWFSEGAMEWFNTVIETQPNVENIFITSERMEPEHPKKYTLRWFDTRENEVVTLGEFRGYETLAAAREARKEFTRSKREMGITY